MAGNASPHTTPLPPIWVTHSPYPINITFFFFHLSINSHFFLLFNYQICVNPYIDKCTELHKSLLSSLSLPHPTLPKEFFLVLDCPICFQPRPASNPKAKHRKSGHIYQAAGAEALLIWFFPRSPHLVPNQVHSFKPYFKENLLIFLFFSPSPHR